MAHRDGDCLGDFSQECPQSNLWFQNDQASLVRLVHLGSTGRPPGNEAMQNVNEVPEDGNRYEIVSLSIS